ncbi:MAG: response regulator [Candidatus Saccharibacteria bacterium]|nr:response regulator [Candidatus Saccharibacteria bacterium]
MANILIVEDDKDLNQAYQMILKRDGHDVSTATNGEEALKKATASTPELILLDLLMPIMGGLEFLKRYDLSKHSEVKVLIFTNMENSPEVSEAYNLGAHRCIVKSWTAPQNLSHVVNEALKTKTPA